MIAIRWVFGWCRRKRIATTTPAQRTMRPPAEGRVFWVGADGRTLIVPAEIRSVYA